MAKARVRIVGGSWDGETVEVTDHVIRLDRRTAPIVGPSRHYGHLVEPPAQEVYYFKELQVRGSSGYMGLYAHQDLSDGDVVRRLLYPGWKP